jgi:YVTN family beta-propeller protein
VGLAPYGVDFDAAGQRAFVTNQHGGTVSVISLAERKVVATWTAGDYPEGIAYLPGPGGAGGVGAEAAAAAVAVSGAGVAGMLLVVSWMDDCVHLLDAATGQRLATLDTGANPRGFGAMIWRRP